MEINDFGQHKFNEKKGRLQGLKTLFASLKKLALANKLPSTMIGLALIIAVVGVVFAFATRQGNSTELPSPSPIESPSPSEEAQSSPIDTPSDNSTITDESTPSPIPSPTSSPTTSEPDHSHSNLYADPSSVPADGSTQSKITIMLRDTDGNPISGAALNLTSSDGGAVFKTYSSGSEVTDSSGNAIFTMTSTNAGTDNVDVNITINGITTALSDLGQVTFTPISSPTP